MKVQHDENATLIHVIYNEPIAWNVLKRREANCINNLIVPLQSLSFFFFLSRCKAIKSYIFSASGHHQRMVVVENNPVV